MENRRSAFGLSFIWTPAQVEILLGVTEGRVKIAVLDRGRGMPREIRDSTFDLFVTGTIRGSGIGLSICRRFVEAARSRLTLAERRRESSCLKPTRTRRKGPGDLNAGRV